LRIGYATSANIPPAYSTRATLYTATQNFLTAKGTAININSVPPLLPNPDLKPELLKETEAGVEGRFLNNMVDVDLTVYRRVWRGTVMETSMPLELQNPEQWTFFDFESV